MDYAMDIQGKDAVVRLRGRLTFNDHACLRALIREMLGNAATRQVFDLEGLEFVDSAGIGMLLIAREEMAGVDKELVLRGAAGQVRRVLAVAQLDKIVAIED
ncbi:STAS domain-containing protein [Azospirillum sp. ST 5-10]|uniref:STAS domain-containing protein n=1 Tax=unclassified Azospirillum TaxID=2630922 RepID=UPI003F49C28A